MVLNLKFLALPEPSHFAGLWPASEFVGRAKTAISSKAGFQERLGGHERFQGAWTSNLSRGLFYLAISTFLDSTSTICIPYMITSNRGQG